MDTKILKINLQNIKNFENELKYAAEKIKDGELVVIPTETVYGLGGDATNPEAAKKIYEAKGRPSDNPLIIHISTPEDAERYTYTNEVYYKLADRFMPGPLTVVLPAKDSVPRETRGGLDTVAVRCPENIIARRVIEYSGVAIAAPSANLSGSPSPTSAKHVIDDMMGRVSVIIDGGDCDFGLESTIVKIEDDGSLLLLRPGKITLEELSLVADVTVANAVTDSLREGEVALSPGMKYRHYAPKSPLILLDGSIDRCIKYIDSTNEKNIAVLAYLDDIKLVREKLSYAKVFEFGFKDDFSAQAHLLFSILREADEYDFTTIYAPVPDTSGVGLALYNRMIRAAAHTIIKVDE